MAKKSFINIVMAANAMIENQDKITDVRPRYSDSSFFFLYNNKYLWEISHIDSNYMLSIYPGYSTIDELFEEMNYRSDMATVSYSSDELNTKESVETFSELYNIVKQKRYDVDRILEDIVSDSKLWDKD